MSADEVAAATVANRAGTITVRATDQGLPLEIRIDQRELRYGGTQLAASILEVCKRSTLEARVRRRADLTEQGVPLEVLDKLGLPTRNELAAIQHAEAEEEAAPTSWMRQL
ncbi:hypothetical protein [Rhodococcus sp. NPDC058514]|uniref:hypothetical protein n=1 Tax=unclassified Rhodococcus (in: high G+C Gram-positive bacteria) TaxID=192944 RepID=UPI003659562F